MQIENFLPFGLPNQYQRWIKRDLLSVLQQGLLSCCYLLEEQGPFHSEDGKIWSGSISFTASKPIEVEIIHDYKPQQPIDEKHVEPYNFIAPGNRSIAITTLKDIVDVPIEINGTGLSSGSFEFAGSGLVFHKASGEPFTVTYTIDAAAKDVTR